MSAYKSALRTENLTTYKVGQSLFGQVGLIQSQRKDYLLYSVPHFRLPNGSWSGGRGDGFYTQYFGVDHTGSLAVSSSFAGFSFGTCYLAGVAPVPPTLPGNLDSLVVPWTRADADTQRYTATGYKRARPGNPLADVGQFLIELRNDGLPHLPFKGKVKKARVFSKYGMRTIPGIPFQRIPSALKQGVQRAKNSGSEYLNVQFGWKPLVNDLRKMYNLWQKLDKEMGKIIRQNGHVVTRRSTISDDTNVVSDSVYYPFPYYNVYGGGPIFSAGGGTQYSHNNVVKERIWYVGAFRYYIPDVGSSQWTAGAKAALFGALPTPSLIYETTPWSWLADWFTNLGDVISNVSMNAVDNLVTLRSFTMHQLDVQDIYSADVWAAAGSPPLQLEAQSQSFKSTNSSGFKRRNAGGSPFVLSGGNDSLSTGQLATLAALGLSKL